MRNIWTILKRELNSYFNSGIAYIYLIVFLAINNGLFMTRFFLMGRADMRLYFESLPTILFVFIPAITMRLWAEDKKENTFELLMTFPMRPRELVLGKFLASLIFYSLTLLSTITIPIILFAAGSPDSGAIIGGYLGSFLTGALFLAIGIFISGLTKEQIVAFVLTTLSCFLFFFLGTDFFAAFIDGWIGGWGTFIKNYIGTASHTISFSKGVISIKDILYFTAAISVFLILNGFYFEGRLRPKAKAVFSLSVIVSILGLIIFNWLIHDLRLGRFDITETKIYTTSLVSRKMLGELKVPVYLSLYISPQNKMPTALKTIEQDISGKLEELKIISNNKFNYKIFHIEASNLIEQNQNPGESSDTTGSLEKKLQDKGVLPFQVESIDKDEVGLKLIYSAITIAYKEKNEEILPRLTPRDIPDLEYLILSRIAKLTREKKPNIALFSPLKNEGLSPEISRLIQGMAESESRYEDEYKTVIPLMRNNGYNVKRINLTKDDPITGDLNTLLILNPGKLDDRQLYEINKFLTQGGAVLIAAQGFEYAFQSGGTQGIEISPKKADLDINRLIQKWGVKINDEMLMDESSQIIEVTTGQRVGPFALSMPIKVPNQILVTNEMMRPDMPLMNRLPSLFFMWGSALEISPDALKTANLKETLMFSSSKRSWKAPSDGSNLKKELLTFPKSNPEGAFPLAVMLEGDFSDTFQSIPQWPNQDTQTPAQNQETAPALTPKPGKLIITGCSKMFTDQLMSGAGNLNLFANIVDGLTLGTDIIQIRSNTLTSRELNKLTNPQKAWYKFIAVFLVPILLVLYGSLRLFIRGKEKQLYLAATAK